MIIMSIILCLLLIIIQDKGKGYSVLTKSLWSHGLSLLSCDSYWPAPIKVIIIIIIINLMFSDSKIILHMLVQILKWEKWHILTWEMADGAQLDIMALGDIKQEYWRESQPAQDSLKGIESTICDRMTVALQLITPRFSAFLLWEHTLWQDDRLGWLLEGGGWLSQFLSFFFAGAGEAAEHQGLVTGIALLATQIKREKQQARVDNIMDFLAVHNSSIGDLVTHWVSQSHFWF